MPVKIRSTVYRGRKAWELDNDRIRLVMTQGGGHIASLELRDVSGVNPLWRPVWPTMEPWEYMANDARRFSSRLLASILGHNLCLGWFGGPSEDEKKAGMECHGEAGVARWRLLRKKVTSRAVSMTCACELPVAGMSFVRTVSAMRGCSVVSVREEIVSRSRRDLPFTMSEHVTFGPPFLEKGVTVFDMPATKAHTYPIHFEDNPRLKTNTAFKWPAGPGIRGEKVDMRMISKSHRKSSDFSTQLMDQKRKDAWFSALNPKLGLLVAYSWSREDFPWIGNWEENYGRKLAPWNGRSLTRGMEFTNTPFPMALRATADRGRMHGLPTVRWLPARGRLTFSYSIIMAPVMPDVKGVRDIRQEDGRFSIELA
jgi:hypothetical protein